MPAAPGRPPRPGWYDDPRTAEEESSDWYRWWDGEAWTQWVADSPHAPTPRGPTARVVPVPVLTRHRGIRAFGIGLGVLVVLTALTAVSLLGQGLPSESRPFLEARPSVLGPPARVYRPYEFRPDRTAVVYERVVLPLPEDARVDGATTSIRTVLRNATVAYAPLGKGGRATVALGDAEPDVVVPGDATATARKVLPALLGRYQLKVGFRTEDVRVVPWPAIPGAVRLTARLRYDKPVDGADAEEVTMTIVSWQQAEHSGMAVSVVLIPTTAAPEERRRLLSAHETIRLIQ